MEAYDQERRRLGDATRDAVARVKEQVDLEGRVERSPYGTVAIALGVGYVLGGGLFSPLTGRTLSLGLRLGLRLVVLPIVAEQLLGFAGSVVAGDAPPEPCALEATPSGNGGATLGSGV